MDALIGEQSFNPDMYPRFEELMKERYPSYNGKLSLFKHKNSESTLYYRSILLDTET